MVIQAQATDESREIVPLLDTEELARRVAGAHTVVLDGCGHMVMLERPAELVRELNEFVSICSSQGRSK